jgi:hypothetical protein
LDLLDLCVLEQFWWINATIIQARYLQIEHPQYYSGEYVFDKSNKERTIVTVRQSDIDGKHWKADHLHIQRGTAEFGNDNNKIIHLTFDKHIELTSTVIINGAYIMKMF